MNDVAVDQTPYWPARLQIHRLNVNSLHQ